MPNFRKYAKFLKFGRFRNLADLEPYYYSTTTFLNIRC